MNHKLNKNKLKYNLSFPLSLGEGRGEAVLACLFSILVFLSCTDDRMAKEDTGRVAATFTPTIQGVQQGTRASGSSWLTSDRVGIYMLAYDKDKLPGYEANRQFYASASGEKTTLLPATPDQLIYYPIDGSKVKFVAYYPYYAAIDPEDSDPIRPVDVSDQSATDMDLLACVSPGDYCIEQPNANLVFKHQLSKVTIKITRETGVTDDLSDLTAILSGMPTTGDFRIAGQTFDNLGDVADITPHTISTSATTATFEAIVIPQSSGMYEDRLIAFTLDSETMDYPVSKHALFENGKSYTYEFTYTGTTMLWTNTTVTEWLGDKYSWVGDDWMSVSVGEMELNADASSENLLVLYTNNADEDDLEIYISDSPTTYDPDDQPGVDWIKIQSFLPKTGEQGTYYIKFGVDQYKENSGGTGGDPGGSTGGGGTGGIGVGDWEEGQVIGRSMAYSGHVEPDNITVIDDYQTYFNYTFGNKVTTRADDEGTRTGYLHITNGVVTIVVKIKQNNISLGGAYRQPEANCYMVHPSGLGIAIPIAGRAGDYSRYTCEVLWSDDSNSVAVSPNSSIRYVGIKHVNYAWHLVVFPGSSEGNAVVVVKADGQIRWSWHIWTTAYNPYSHYPATLPNGTVVMDHNLGATKAPGYTTIQPGKEGSNGLYYQWGRKDPFTNSATEVVTVESGPVTVETTIQNPFTFYTGTGDWNASPSNYLWFGGAGEKTIYDPCPVDWRVPAVTAWTGLAAGNFAWNGTLKGRSHTTAGWYPAAGYYNTSGVPTNVGTEGYYWTATNNGANASDMSFASGNLNISNTAVRTMGYPVRCVRDN